MDEIKQTPTFDYVDLWRDEDTGQPLHNKATGFTLDWCGNRGFGLFSFVRRANGIFVGDEYMGLKNVEKALTLFCESVPKEEWPMLLLECGSVQQIMAAVTDWESKK